VPTLSAARAVLATLDEFAADNVLAKARRAVRLLLKRAWFRLQELPFVGNIRGEKGRHGLGGIEMRGPRPVKSAADWANAAVLACLSGVRGMSAFTCSVHLPREFCGLRRLW